MGLTYTKDEFIAALREAGINSGDLVMAHVGMSGLGMLPQGIRNQEELSEFCCSCLLQAVGEEGTLCIPSFSYSFGRGECYDPESTPTRDIGEFPEYFRKKSGAVRSSDPFLAMSVKGQLADELIKERANSSYGKGSFFDCFINAGGKIVTIGVGIRWATIRYHFAEIGHAPFRYLKRFVGKRKIDGKEQSCQWEYSVSPYADKVDKISRRMGYLVEDMLDHSSLLKKASVGKGYISCIVGTDFRDYILKLLCDDPWFSSEGISSYGEIIEEERKRTGRESYNVTLYKSSMEQMAEQLTPLPRYLLSDGYDAALSALSHIYGFNIREYYTGQRVKGWIVPERWICRDAFLESMDGIRIASLDTDSMLVRAHSKAVDKVVDREELFDHIDTLELENAIPVLTSYYDREWGLCLKRNIFEQLSEEKYHVKIDADFSFDKMKVGELTIPGRYRRKVLFVAHLDGAKQFNYGLSGVFAGLEIFDTVWKEEIPDYIYKFLIVPQTIGLAAWLEENGEEEICGIILLDLLGTAGGKFTIVRSQYGNSCLDKVVTKLFMDSKSEFQVLEYDENPLDEERMVSDAGIDIPYIRIMRTCERGSKAWPFKGYKTSLDHYENVDFIQYKNTINCLKMFIKNIDKERF